MSWKDGPWQAIASAIDGAKDMFPVYEEEVTATIFGNAKSTNQSLFNQGVAICFGIIKAVTDGSNVDVIVPYFLNAEYDMMHKICVVTMRWTYSGVFSQNPGSEDKLRDRFFSAPPDNVTPGNPDFSWLNRYLRKSGSKALKDAMNFSDPVVWGKATDIADGRPSVRANGVNALNDNASRGSTFLEKLVLASLSAGCTNTDFWSKCRSQPTAVQPKIPSGAFTAGSSQEELLNPNNAATSVTTAGSSVSELVDRLLNP